MRGEAAELAARYAGEPPRGEVVLVIGAAPPREGADPRGGRRGPPAGRRRRPRPPGRLGRRRAHGRSCQRSVPSCDRRRTRPQRLTRARLRRSGAGVAASTRRRHARPLLSCLHRLLPPCVRRIALAVLRSRLDRSLAWPPSGSAAAAERQSAAPRCAKRRAASRPSPVLGARDSASPPRGQHRGVDFAARGPVRAACAGRVVFAGPRRGRGDGQRALRALARVVRAARPGRACARASASARARGSAGRCAGCTSASAARAGGSATSTRCASSARAAVRRRPPAASGRAAAARPPRRLRSAPARRPRRTPSRGRRRAARAVAGLARARTRPDRTLRRR